MKHLTVENVMVNDLCKTSRQFADRAGANLANSAFDVPLCGCVVACFELESYFMNSFAPL